MKRVRRLLAVCSLALLAPAARAEMLADSTVREAWKPCAIRNPASARPIATKRAPSELFTPSPRSR